MAGFVESDWKPARPGPLRSGPARSPGDGPSMTLENWRPSRPPPLPYRGTTIWLKTARKITAFRPLPQRSVGSAAFLRACRRHPPRVPSPAAAAPPAQCAWWAPRRLAAAPEQRSPAAAAVSVDTRSSGPWAVAWGCAATAGEDMRRESAPGRAAGCGVSGPELQCEGTWRSGLWASGSRNYIFLSVIF